MTAKSANGHATIAEALAKQAWDRVRGDNTNTDAPSLNNCEMMRPRLTRAEDIEPGAIILVLLKTRASSRRQPIEYRRVVIVETQRTGENRIRLRGRELGTVDPGITLSATFKPDSVFTNLASVIEEEPL